MEKITYSKNKYITIVWLSVFLTGCWNNTRSNENSNPLSLSINGKWEVFKIVHGNGAVQKTPEGANVSFSFKKNLTFEVVYKMNDDVVEKYDGTYTLLPDSTLHTYKLKEGGHDEFRVVEVTEDTLRLLDTKKSKDIMCLLKIN
ncbi:MAG: lipocalin family protein [Ferruginibacter sp.]